MKVFSFTICVVLVIGAFNVCSAGKPAKGCADVPITIAFVAPSIGTATILNDDPTKVYLNGVDGIDNEVIHFNSDCNGTHDATIVIGHGPKAKRKLWIQFPSVIPGSLIEGGPASFAGGASFLSTTAFMNIRNLTGYTSIPPGVAATYYTRISLQFRGPDGVDYRLMFYPDDYACPAGEICVANRHPVGGTPTTNQPLETEWAKVTYTPRNASLPWSTTNTDQWVLEGILTTAADPVIERATLSLNGAPYTHYGQYSMPFKILITAQAALPQ